MAAPGARVTFEPEAKKTEEMSAEEAERERRFREYYANKGKTKGNPMYATSSAVHGSFPTGSQPPEPSKFGKSCKFSDLYVGARSKSEGLITGLDKSKIHKAFDQGF